MGIYVVIRDMSAGNDVTGEAWQETKVFDGNATLDEVAKWAMDDFISGAPSRKRVTLTRPHTE